MNKFIVLFVALTTVMMILAAPQPERGFLENGEENDEIVGGNAVERGSRPYMVHLLLTDSNGGVSACGGTILDERHILTAAHCVTGERAIVSIEIRMRVYTIDPMDDSSVIATVSGSNAVFHEQYNLSGEMENDIAIINLDVPISFEEEFCFKDEDLCLQIKTVDWANSSSIPDSGTDAWAVGWGQTYSGQVGIPPNMQEVQLRVLTAEECKRIYKEKYNGETDPSPSQICVIQSQSVCRGDSGGPLMVGTTQIGIASYVGDYSCDQLQIFTRVSTFVENGWIAGKLAN